MIRFGLRGKSLFAIGVSCIFVLIISIFIGRFFMNSAQQYSADMYAKNFTELNALKLLVPISREIALSKQFSHSVVLQEWMNDPNSANKSLRLQQEVRRVRQGLHQKSLFFGLDSTLRYYYEDDKTPLNLMSPYILREDNLADQWYFRLRQDPSSVNLNIDFDAKIQDSRIWINIPINQNGRLIGAVGTGLDISLFLDAFLTSEDPSVTQIIVNELGDVLLHPDESLIQFDKHGALLSNKALHSMLVDDEQEELDNLLKLAKKTPELAVNRIFNTKNKSKIIISLSYLPLLNWNVVTVVDLHKANFINDSIIIYIIAFVILFIILLLICFGLVVNRLVISPITMLQQYAKSIADGVFDVDTKKYMNDEIGDLSHSLFLMAEQIQKNTQDLERTVQQRTELLEISNKHLFNVNKKLEDSIEYASLLQKAILPKNEMARVLGDQCAVLWEPKDRVGGDFYMLHRKENTFLLGVIDCAGHGVPGALMTMLMRAAIDSSISQIGINDPAALLSLTDHTIRTMMSDLQSAQLVAANADAGFIYADPSQGILKFAGAKMNLYGTDGQTVNEWPGGRRSLADRKKGEYANIELPLFGAQYYLVTDGFLDQSGGSKHFGFGKKRFRDLIIDNAHLSPAAQGIKFMDNLSLYKGELLQRDDITLLLLSMDESIKNYKVE